MWVSLDFSRTLPIAFYWKLMYYISNPKREKQNLTPNGRSLDHEVLSISEWKH